MRIGEAAAAAGMTTKTLRFYEAQGLLPPPVRKGNGYRSYGPGLQLPLTHRRAKGRPLRVLARPNQAARSLLPRNGRWMCSFVGGCQASAAHGSAGQTRSRLNVLCRSGLLHKRPAQVRRNAAGPRRREPRRCSQRNDRAP